MQPSGHLTRLFAGKSLVTPQEAPGEMDYDGAQIRFRAGSYHREYRLLVEIYVPQDNRWDAYFLCSKQPKLLQTWRANDLALAAAQTFLALQNTPALSDFTSVVVSPDDVIVKDSAGNTYDAAFLSQFRQNAFSLKYLAPPIVCKGPVLFDKIAEYWTGLNGIIELSKKKSTPLVGMHFDEWFEKIATQGVKATPLQAIPPPPLAAAAPAVLPISSAPLPPVPEALDASERVLSAFVLKLREQYEVRDNMREAVINYFAITEYDHFNSVPFLSRDTFSIARQERLAKVNERYSKWLGNCSIAEKVAFQQVVGDVFKSNKQGLCLAYYFAHHESDFDICLNQVIASQFAPALAQPVENAAAKAPQPAMPSATPSPSKAQLLPSATQFAAQTSASFSEFTRNVGQGSKKRLNRIASSMAEFTTLAPEDRGLLTARAFFEYKLVNIFSQEEYRRKVAAWAGFDEDQTERFVRARARSTTSYYASFNNWRGMKAANDILEAQHHVLQHAGPSGNRRAGDEQRAEIFISTFNEQFDWTVNGLCSAYMMEHELWRVCTLLDRAHEVYTRQTTC